PAECLQSTTHTVYALHIEPRPPPIPTLFPYTTLFRSMVAARLGDLMPNGRVTRLTYGLLNLTHRDSHEHPQPLVPGKRYTIRVQDRKSTRLNSSHVKTSYAAFCL